LRILQIPQMAALRSAAIANPTEVLEYLVEFLLYRFLPTIEA
jgi:hypothetical protein